MRAVPRRLAVRGRLREVRQRCLGRRRAQAECGHLRARGVRHAARASRGHQRRRTHGAHHGPQARHAARHRGRGRRLRAPRPPGARPQAHHRAWRGVGPPLERDLEAAGRVRKPGGRGAA
eukprot:374879-Pyramimonas_sp.AAC.1